MRRLYPQSAGRLAEFMQQMEGRYCCLNEWEGAVLSWYAKWTLSDLI